MGKAYSEEQRARVKALLELGRDEEAIEKETGVSDRTIRRWKLELERTGRIGKPPESRTGRHRVLSPEIEAALFQQLKVQPGMSVDEMLWWLYDEHKLVVGTRTMRRVFERKGGKSKAILKGKAGAKGDEDEGDEEEDDDEDSLASPEQTTGQYQSTYAPIAQQAQQAAQELANALGHDDSQQPQTANDDNEEDAEEDEETIALELQQIALQKREVELKLKMRRLQQGKGTPVAKRTGIAGTPQSAPSTLYNPTTAASSTPAKRDSRSKKKIEESKRRTAERQERMLRDLERRSRRRDHLTAEWVQSKDIWPLRAQERLADLMHQFGCYAYSQNSMDTFEDMYNILYQLVDRSKGDWIPQIHDEMLRERTKRKMGQLRNKMQKTGEIIGRSDAYGGWQKADNFTGEAAGQAIGDESEMPDTLATQAGAPQMADDQMHYEPVPDHQGMQHPDMGYGVPMMQHQGQPQYSMMPQQHHNGMLPYGQMDGSHQEGMVM